MGETKGPGTKRPGPNGPGTKGPWCKGPGAKGPVTKGPGTKGPGTKDPGPKSWQLAEAPDYTIQHLSKTLQYGSRQLVLGSSYCRPIYRVTSYVRHPSNCSFVMFSRRFLTEEGNGVNGRSSTLNGPFSMTFRSLFDECSMMFDQLLSVI